jgi:hypothetical protein
VVIDADQTFGYDLLCEEVSPDEVVRRKVFQLALIGNSDRGRIRRPVRLTVLFERGVCMTRDA